MATTSPFFSIIIPTKNRLALLQICITSILNQKYGDFELLVIDDGSCDGTWNWLSSFSDSRVKIFQNEGIERSSARNTGLNYVKGKYICFVDDDDWIKDDFLQNFYDTISKQNYPNDVIFRTGFIKMDSKGSTAQMPNYSINSHKSALEFAALQFCSVCTLAIPSNLLISEKFDTRFPHWQDTHLILRIFQKSSLVQLPFYSYFYRMHDQMGTTLIQDSESFFEERLKLNVLAISDYFENYNTGPVKLSNSIYRFLLAEKYIEYANRTFLVKNITPNLKFKLLVASLKKGCFLKLWKHYGMFVKNLLRI
ncbi:MAG TPA: glycosyltransferase family 2 protein [Saprospiraceae bacterium]|nr:glycosyltransferase family 2 protein [Saprospiraceae bacterium]HPN69359.1 glycosyltransferase family 2 protein [Saprospiraceae bacterium]